MSAKTPEQNHLIIASSPHLRCHRTTTSVMGNVLIALLPIVIATAFIYGCRVLLSVAVASITAILAEFLIQKAMKRKQTIQDLSCIVTAVILVLNLPLDFPFWQLIVGTIFAIVVVKAAFGGLGQNFANPAVTTRIVLVSAFASSFAKNSEPLARALHLSNSVMDSSSSATVLVLLKAGTDSNELCTLRDLFFGIQRTTAIGETCAIAILLGGLYLLFRKIIKWYIPISYIGTVAVLSFLFGGFSIQFMLYHLFSGGLLFSAFFMATDYTTSPLTNKGKFIFGIGLGILTSIIRFWSNLPEGVSFAILTMNILTPHIDRFTKEKPFGTEFNKQTDL
ncbi:MAG: RnfABCDGE type electron transport complex subunit D [Clostridiaceae bacterium]|nr:RnfABCDGE type electron transport complex subunit D [Clostridiaceae bacterium]